MLFRKPFHPLHQRFDFCYSALGEMIQFDDVKFNEVPHQNGIGDSWPMVYHCYVGPARSSNKVWWCLRAKQRHMSRANGVFFLTSGDHPLKPWEVRATHVAAEWLQWWQCPTFVYFCEDECELYIHRSHRRFIKSKSHCSRPTCWMNGP